MFDIFFISYQESNCEQNWRRLLDFHLDAKRIHGITGIHNVHLAADALSQTDFFWTVDGDNYLLKPLKINCVPEVDLTIFHSKDPLCIDSTALGAVKLWRKGRMIHRDMSKGDFALFSTQTKKVVPDCYSITIYNATPYETWKTSFRHCVKLLSCILQSRDPKYATNINRYIDNWRNTQNVNVLNSNWAYQGFLDAQAYVKIHDNNISELNKINDYKWLSEFWSLNHAA